jgi:hypothetical protein
VSANSWRGRAVGPYAGCPGFTGAVAAGERNAPYALRQALVDLAAIAELVADDLPAPTV